MTTANLTIDGQKVEVAQGATVLEAAQNAGIYIPTLCHDPDLEPYGGCRLCIVEIEGLRGLVPSCTTRVTNGMKVLTETDDIARTRRMTAELLIADHPQDCLSCSSNQNCELQKVAAYLGVDNIRLGRSVRDIEKDKSNPFFTRDMQKCVLCARCVRACREVRRIEAIDVAFRGYDSRISPFGDSPILQSICTSCGECVDRCPTGALSANAEALPPTKSVKTICPYCGCGCGLSVGIRAGKVVHSRGDRDNEVNRGSLCVKGRFGMDFIHAKDRLKTPLVRKEGQCRNREGAVEGGEFREATWEEALDLIAMRFAEIKDKHGPKTLAGLASAKCSNEENYLMQKLVRVGFGTNNIDHCARL